MNQELTQIVSLSFFLSLLLLSLSRSLSQGISDIVSCSTNSAFRCTLAVGGVGWKDGEKHRWWFAGTSKQEMAVHNSQIWSCMFYIVWHCMLITLCESFIGKQRWQEMTFVNTNTKRKTDLWSPNKETSHTFWLFRVLNPPSKKALHQKCPHILYFKKKQKKNCYEYLYKLTLQCLILSSTSVRIHCRQVLENPCAVLFELKTWSNKRLGMARQNKKHRPGFTDRWRN